MRLISLVVAAALLSAPGAWTDPTGDAQGGPDVTQVAASVAGGTVTFTVHTSNAASWDGAVAFILIDSVAGAGDGNGADDELTLHSLHDKVTHERWNGNTWELVSPSNASFSLVGPTLTMRVPLSELGDPSQLGFVVETRGPTGGDNAPDSGQWRLSTAAPPRFAPPLPVHGRVFAVVGGVSCKAKLRGRTLPGSCRWKIPASARGARLVVLVAGRTYSFRVR
jgi:hypothetical protein